MPVKRRQHKSRPHRITPEAIAAFEAGDFSALHCALGLAPWQPSPLPQSVTPLGVDPVEPPPDGGVWSASWPLAVDLQRELISAGAKMPAPRPLEDQATAEAIGALPQGGHASQKPNA